MNYYKRLSYRTTGAEVVAVLCVAIAVLMACSSTSPTQPTPPVMTLESIQQAVITAEAMAPEERDLRFIELSQQLYMLGEIQRATTVVEKVNPDHLNNPSFIKYILIAVELYSNNQTIFPAYDLLTSTRVLELWPELSKDQQIALHQHRAWVFSQFGDSKLSILERIKLGELLTDSLDITENNELIWQDLNKLTLTDLNTTPHENPIVSGWYELAAISKTYENNLEEQQVKVTQWIELNTGHPASSELPLDLQLLTTLIEQRPESVALLLPMTGKLAKAGKTIRDGFFVAYYNQQEGNKPKTKLYDTNKGDIDELYNQAVAEGADLIIGPLDKTKVAQLQQRSVMPVPILALNYINGVSTANNLDATYNIVDETEINELLSTEASFYQYGLSLEDEAIQAADRAWLEGHRYAMIIASSADWSTRAASTFARRWREQGGIVVIDRRFDKDSNYSNTIKSAFGIDKSEARARKLKRLFGKNFEFEPRRRQDIDMIFLVSRSSEGQQIKPTLAFHYARDIPVYATSQIYSSTEGKSKNRDLNGIRFTTLPWTLEPNNIEKQMLKKYVDIPANYERLYAMGVDSFLLHNRLKQLNRSSNASIYGKTGKLYLNEQRRIVREQPWAEIVKGEAKALPFLTKETSVF